MRTKSSTLSCPYCVSDDFKPNNDWMKDGKKFVCKKCGRKFSEPIRQGVRSLYER